MSVFYGWDILHFTAKFYEHVCRRNYSWKLVGVLTFETHRRAVTRCIAGNMFIVHFNN